MIKDKRLRSIAKMAREDYRQLKNSVAGVTVLRVEDALSAADYSPDDVIASFETTDQSIEYASGSKAVKASDVVKEINALLQDPFAKNRGLVAICHAIIDYVPPVEVEEPELVTA